MLSLTPILSASDWNWRNSMITPIEPVSVPDAVGASALRPRSGLALVARVELVPHDVGQGELAALTLAPQVCVDFVALLAATERLDGERDALLARVDLRDLGFDLVADLVER